MASRKPDFVLPAAASDQAYPRDIGTSPETTERTEEYRVVGRYHDGWPFEGPTCTTLEGALRHAQRCGPLREQQLQRTTTTVTTTRTPWVDLNEGEGTT